ncbi:hypothetical protein GQ607_011786 [Colletotrichum asianum]|uniref:Uncharacterized protein n=1 Tax=Colletotrichum asianum TaxID=702518 RepID=A0A8H3W4E3_9PEZI|nr:hypothetical protein GQ607_011786 [Colletotrichum asianum]
MCQNALASMVRLTEMCLRAQIDLKTLYQPGGFLHNAASTPKGLYWTKSTASNAVEAFRQKHPNIADADVAGKSRLTTRPPFRNNNQRFAQNGPVESFDDGQPAPIAQTSQADAETFEPVTIDAVTNDVHSDDDDVFIITESIRRSSDVINIVNTDETVHPQVRPTALLPAATATPTLQSERQTAIDQLLSSDYLSDATIDLLQQCLIKQHGLPPSTMLCHPLYFKLSNEMPKRLPRQIRNGQTLGVFHITERRIDVYDPLSIAVLAENVKAAANKWFGALLPGVPFMGGPQQDDGTSCGAFCLLALQHLMQGHSSLDEFFATGAAARRQLAHLLNTEDGSQSSAESCCDRYLSNTSVQPNTALQLGNAKPKTDPRFLPDFKLSSPNWQVHAVDHFHPNWRPDGCHLAVWTMEPGRPLHDQDESPLSLSCIKRTLTGGDGPPSPKRPSLEPRRDKHATAEPKDDEHPEKAALDALLAQIEAIQAGAEEFSRRFPSSTTNTEDQLKQAETRLRDAQRERDEASRVMQEKEAACRAGRTVVDHAQKRLRNNEAWTDNVCQAAMREQAEPDDSIEKNRQFITDWLENTLNGLKLEVLKAAQRLEALDSDLENAKAVLVEKETAVASAEQAHTEARDRHATYTKRLRVLQFADRAKSL